MLSVISANSTFTATTSVGAVGTQTYKGGTFILNVSALSGTLTPTVTVKLQARSITSNTYIDLPGAAFPAVTAVGLYMLQLYPGLTAVTNAAVNGILPDEIQAVVTVSGTTPSFTLHLGLHGVS